MAVIYEGKHHRNPSGLNNKVNWLLRHSNYNLNQLLILILHIETSHLDDKSIESWSNAICITCDTITSGYYKFKVGDKVKFTKDAIIKFNNPSHGCPEFRSYWNSVKDTEYWIIDRHDRDTRFVDKEVFLVDWKSWCITEDDLELY